MGSKLNIFKYFFIVLVALLIICCKQNVKKEPFTHPPLIENGLDDVLDQAEEPAILLECESEEKKLLCSSQKLVEYILKNIEFNNIDNSSESTLIISFIIEKDGSLSTIESLRGKTTIERSNLYEILQNTPEWIPAKNGGKLVRFRYKLPIKVNYQ